MACLSIQVLGWISISGWLLYRKVNGLPLESYQHICPDIRLLFHQATSPVQHRLHSPENLACYCAPMHDHCYHPVIKIEDKQGYKLS